MGYTPNTQYLRDAGSDPAFAAALDYDGFLAHDAALRIPGLPNVYGAGDLLQVREFEH
jgi:hypothetical protein